MKPEYRYAVIDKRTKDRVTNYFKEERTAKGQLTSFFKDGSYKVGKFKIELVEDGE